jgi:integrase
MTAGWSTRLECSSGTTPFLDRGLDTLATFRATWTEGPRTSLKKLERLRAFMRFAEKRKWIDDNPAIELKAPKVPNKPTMPFTREEMMRILAALEPYGKSAGIRNAQRLRAFVLLLRYSGLRIGDATQLDESRLDGNKLLLHTQKKGMPAAFCPTWSSRRWTLRHSPAFSWKELPVSNTEA